MVRSCNILLEATVLSTRLSSKGQLVIPQEVRDALGLEVGTLFQVVVQEDKVILEPLLPFYLGFEVR